MCMCMCMCACACSGRARHRRLARIDSVGIVMDGHVFLQNKSCMALHLRLHFTQTQIDLPPCRQVNFSIPDEENRASGMPIPTDQHPPWSARHASPKCALGAHKPLFRMRSACRTARGTASCLFDQPAGPERRMNAHVRAHCKAAGGALANGGRTLSPSRHAIAGAAFLTQRRARDQGRQLREHAGLVTARRFPVGPCPAGVMDLNLHCCRRRWWPGFDSKENTSCWKNSKSGSACI